MNSAAAKNYPPRILRLPEVVSRTGLPRASIYQQMAQGSFPKPIAISTRSRGWIESEVDAWIDERITRPEPGLMSDECGSPSLPRGRRSGVPAFHELDHESRHDLRGNTNSRTVC